MVCSRPVSASVRPGQFISARYRDTKASSIPAAARSCVAASVVAGAAEAADRAGSGCASAQPPVNQAAVERLLRSKDLRFIENAEGNDVEARGGASGCIDVYASLPSAK